MSELDVYMTVTFVLMPFTVLFCLLWLIARERSRRNQQLILLVVSRGVAELGKRGVQRAKALDRLAPELRDALARRTRAR